MLQSVSAALVAAASRALPQTIKQPKDYELYTISSKEREEHLQHSLHAQKRNGNENDVGYGQFLIPSYIDKVKGSYVPRKLRSGKMISILEAGGRAALCINRSIGAHSNGQGARCTINCITAERNTTTRTSTSFKTRSHANPKQNIRKAIIRANARTTSQRQSQSQNESQGVRKVKLQVCIK